ERGEKQKAATYLRRMAEGSTSKAERAELYEQLGDRYLELGEQPQALAAYGEALAARGAPGEEQVSLLEKTLQLQRALGDGEGAARTSALLIDLCKDPRERAERRRDAALLMAERGNAREAAALLEQALAEDPQDETLLATLCELGDNLPDQKQLDRRLSD